MNLARRPRARQALQALTVAGLLAGTAAAGIGPGAGPLSPAWRVARALGIVPPLVRAATQPDLSCGAPGYCVVVGSTGTRAGNEAPFVATEVRGTWGDARPVPGIGRLDHGRGAVAAAVSCPAAGDCVLVGSYAGTGGTILPFIAAQTHGLWHAARELPRLSALAGASSAELTSVSCPKPGDCLVGGEFTHASKTQALTAREVGGRWRRPIELPGTRALNTGGAAQVLSVSCAAPGDCAAGGTYADSPNTLQAFVDSDVRGRWRQAIKVPGLPATGSPLTLMTSVSCGLPGDCAGGGIYSATDGQHAFAVSEANGTWRPAVSIGTVVPHPPGIELAPVIFAVSCTRGGCTAGGTYPDPNGNGTLQAFIIGSDAKGTWGRPRTVPGTVALNAGGNATVLSVSCASAGNCALGGSYVSASPRGVQAFVATEVNGVWRKAAEVPGTAKLNTGPNAAVSSVACPAIGRCAAAGTYTTRANITWVFVTRQR